MSEIKPVTLDQLLPGESGVIQGYAQPHEIHHRLKELGLVHGTRVRVRRCAPLCDPMEIAVRGYHLSLRKQDARYILVKKDDPQGGFCRGGLRHRHRFWGNL